MRAPSLYVMIMSDGESFINRGAVAAGGIQHSNRFAYNNVLAVLRRLLITHTNAQFVT